MSKKNIKKRKFGLKKVKTVSFKIDVDGVDETFEYTEPSSKEIAEQIERENECSSDEKMKIQLDDYKSRTKCVTTGCSKEDGEELVEALFEAIYEEMGAYKWQIKMMNLFQEPKKKK